MSLTSIESMKQLGCVMHWPGSYVGNGTYDDDGDKRGFLILPDGVSITPAGTWTSIKAKDGRNYLKFDGSTNYVGVTSNSAFDLSNSDITICFWAKNSYTGNYAFPILQTIGYYTTGKNGTFSLFQHHTSGSYLFCPTDGTSQDILTTSAVSYNAWHFIALVRIGTGFTLYCDCVSIGTLTSSKGLGYGGTEGFKICKDRTETGSPSNIKDLMIFKGRALSQEMICQIMAETYIQ